MHPNRSALSADVRSIAVLGAPLLANNLSLSGISFAATVMAGQLGARELAGLAVGVAGYQLFWFIGLGLLMAISPSVAQSHGAGDQRALVRFVRQSWWLVLALSVLLVTGMRQLIGLLPVIGIDAQILPVAAGYIRAVSYGMPAMLGFLALRFTSEGLGRTQPIMYIGLLGLVVNVIGNWIFMYGKFGLPALGAVGCGVSAALSMWLMLLAMLVHMRMHRAYRRFEFFAAWDAPHWPALRELLGVGLPIAVAILAEGGLFVAAALMVGAMGAVQAAGHQIALNYASFMFMVPLAISSATTIHVGHTLGRGDVPRARRVGLLGIGMCAVVMLVSALVIVLFNDQIAALYTRDEPVRAMAASLLLMAALFQISDGLQVGTAGALRGFKDTAVPMALCVFSFWGVGFALAYQFGVARGGGPVLVWMGLIAGLALSSLLLVLRFVWMTRARLAVAARDGVMA